MRRPTRRLALSLLGVLWLAALLLFFFGARRKLEAPEPEGHTPEEPEADWDELWDQFEERRYLSARRWKGGEDPYRLHAFNQRESERIPSDRAVRDTRHHSQWNRFRWRGIAVFQEIGAGENVVALFVCLWLV